MDPEGLRTPADICASGFCFVLDFAKGGRIAYVLQWEGLTKTMWITGAAGNTTAHAQAALSVIEAQAKSNGAQILKFQTVRHGLIKRAINAGYSARGFVLSKALK